MTGPDSVKTALPLGYRAENLALAFKVWFWDQQPHSTWPSVRNPKSCPLPRPLDQTVEVDPAPFFHKQRKPKNPQGTAFLMYLAEFAELISRVFQLGKELPQLRLPISLISRGDPIPMFVLENHKVHSESLPSSPKHYHVKAEHKSLSSHTAFNSPPKALLFNSLSPGPAN